MKDHLRKVAYGSETVRRGSDGETHQTTDDGYAELTTQQGMPIADDQNTLRQRPRG